MALVPFSRGYAPPAYAPTRDPVRARRRRQGLVCLALVVAGWLAGLTGSGRGWLTIALACLVVVLLGAHRAGGAGWLARVVAEYAVVALLAVLLATTGTPAPTRPGPADQGHPTVAQAAADARDWLAAWWRWADQQAKAGRR
jgi:hypothetical protein